MTENTAPRDAVLDPETTALEFMSAAYSRRSGGIPPGVRATVATVNAFTDDLARRRIRDLRRARLLDAQAFLVAPPKPGRGPWDPAALARFGAWLVETGRLRRNPFAGAADPLPAVTPETPLADALDLVAPRIAGAHAAGTASTYLKLCRAFVRDVGACGVGPCRDLTRSHVETYLVCRAATERKTTFAGRRAAVGEFLRVLEAVGAIAGDVSGPGRVARPVAEWVPLPEDLAEALRIARAVLNCTKAELGARLGVSSRTVGAWERATSRPTGPRRAAVGDLLRDVGTRLARRP